MYAYVLSDKSNDVVLPSTITLQKIILNKTSKIVLLDAPTKKIKWKPANDGIIIEVPSELKNKVAGNYAVAFKITK